MKVQALEKVIDDPGPIVVTIDAEEDVARRGGNLDLLPPPSGRFPTPRREIQRCRVADRLAYKAPPLPSNREAQSPAGRPTKVVQQDRCLPNRNDPRVTVKQPTHKNSPPTIRDPQLGTTHEARLTHYK